MQTIGYPKASVPTRSLAEVESDTGWAATAIARLVGPERSVLQLGCASTYLLQILAAQACRVVLVGPEAPIAGQAAAYCERIIPGALDEVELGRELDETQFHVVVSEVLDHLHDPAALLRTVRQHLHPDGYLVVSGSSPALDSTGPAPNTGWRAQGADFLTSSPQRRRQTRETMQALLARAGFAVIHQERQERAGETSKIINSRTSVPTKSDPAPSQNRSALADRTVVVAYPMPATAISLLEKRIDNADSDNEAAQREIVELRQGKDRLTAEKEAIQSEVDYLHQTVEQQARYLDALEIVAERLEQLLEHEHFTGQILLNTATRLVHQMDRLHTILGASTAEEIHPATEQWRADAAVGMDVQEPASIQFPPPNLGPRVSPGADLTQLHKEHYRQMVLCIRQTADRVLPEDVTVVVASKGDEGLLQLGSRTGWHFPQAENGTYAGYYPEDSAAAISHLEALRVNGGHYFLLPSTAYWWLQHYVGFQLHLDNCYQRLWSDEQCMIYQLSG